MCVVTPQASCALLGGAEAAGQARAFVEQSLCHAHAEAIRFEAVLLASELVAQALVEGARPSVLGLDCHGPRVEILVHAAPDRLPERDDRYPALRTFLIERVTPDWGVLSLTDHRTYWCVLTTGEAVREVTP